MKILDNYTTVAAPNTPIYKMQSSRGIIFYRVGMMGGRDALNSGIDYANKFEAEKGAIEWEKIIKKL